MRPQRVKMHLKKPLLYLHPQTAIDLVAYTAFVAARVPFLPFYLQYVYDGKLRPTAYGSTKFFDLGLCYETFYTAKMCRMGAACCWRHAALTWEEKVWLFMLRAKNVEFMEACRRYPHEPESTPWHLALRG
jgi:hypothetical protein